MRSVLWLLGLLAAVYYRLCWPVTDWPTFVDRFVLISLVVSVLCLLAIYMVLP